MYIPTFRPNQRKNQTLWGGTYLNGLYKGLTPPDPHVQVTEKKKFAEAEGDNSRTCNVGFAISNKLNRSAYEHLSMKDFVKLVFN